MKGGIYLIRDDGQLVEMNEQAYDSEDLLQALLAKYPSVLAGDQLGSAEPRRWLLISREVSLPSEEAGAGRWSVDHLFLDQDAIPTIVEVKRSSDTRIRREVVGQMLEYAANAVVYWPIETLRAHFESNCKVLNRDPEQVLDGLIGVDADEEQFWQKAKLNLQAGKVRLVFVADEIPTELRRVVEFLSDQMDPAEVFAVEIRQYVGQGLKTLVPRVVGRPTRPSPVEKQWDETSFLQEVEARRGPEEAVVAKRSLEWAGKTASRIKWGKGRQSGSFAPVVDHKGTPLTLFSVWTSGHVQMYFQHLGSKPPFEDEERRLGLLRRLNQISTIEMPADALGRYPSFFLSALTSKSAQQQFFEAFEWAPQEIKAS